MFGLDGLELLVIAVVALIVLGPERLPKAARFAGLWVRKARAQWFSVRAEFEREMAADELRRNLAAPAAELRDSLSAPAAELRDSLTAPVAELRDSLTEPATGLRDSVAGAGRDLRGAVADIDRVVRAPAVDDTDRDARAPAADDADAAADPAQSSLFGDDAPPPDDPTRR